MITTKKKLEESLRDLAQGAMGGFQIDHEPGLCAGMGVEEWLRFVDAAKLKYGHQCHDHVFELHNLHKFDDIYEAADLLWNGAKKDGGKE